MESQFDQAEASYRRLTAAHARSRFDDSDAAAATVSSTIPDAATEREMPQPPLTTSDGMTPRPTREYRPNGSA